MAKVKNRRMTIRDLQRAGIPVKPARRYLPKDWRRYPATSLERMQAILAKFKGSLAEEVVRLREDSL